MLIKFGLKSEEKKIMKLFFCQYVGIKSLHPSWKCW